VFQEQLSNLGCFLTEHNMDVKYNTHYTIHCYLPSVISPFQDYPSAACKFAFKEISLDVTRSEIFAS